MNTDLTLTNSLPATTPGPDKAKRAVSSDFQTFLTMLTAQMQNQDPLNPIESTDYAVQLATFSSVEQQVKTNDLLAGLGQQFAAMGIAQAAGWVGMEAKVAAPVQFDGSPVSLDVNIPAAAQGAVLVVTNSTGAEVSRQPIDPTTSALEWAGVDADGQPMAPGSYSFAVETVGQDGAVSSLPVESYALIREIRLSGATVNIVLAGGAEVAAADISALRMPEA